MSDDMRLKAVYFKGLSLTGLPYHKALVYEQDVPWFLAKGAVEKQPTEVPVEVPAKTESGKEVKKNVRATSSK